MKLYYTTTSPFVRKVTVAALERGLDARIERITLRPSPLSANAELLRHNPINKIPALVTDDGESLYDSGVICEYLDSLGDAPPLVPPAGPARWRVLRLQALADGIIEAGIQAFYERTQRPDGMRWQPWADGQLEKVEKGLDALEAQAPGFGTSPDLGTISVGVAVAWLSFRQVADPHVGRPSLSRWYAAFAERPSMKTTVPRA